MDLKYIRENETEAIWQCLKCSKYHTFPRGYYTLHDKPTTELSCWNCIKEGK